MALGFEPVSPWFQATLCAVPLFAVILAMRWRLDLRRNRPPLFLLGQRQSVRVAVLGFLWLALAFLILAASGPYPIKQDHNDAFHLVLVLDVSDSVTRAGDGAGELCRRLSEVVADHVAAMPRSSREQGTAGIITFRDQAALAHGEIAPDQLPITLKQLDPRLFATGSGSDPAAGLKRARRELAARGGRGAVLLVTDGNQTRGDVLVEARHLASEGIAVHVLPLEGGRPELAIDAAYLPPQVQTETETFLRGSLRNSSSEDTPANLQLARNPGLQRPDTQVGEPLQNNEDVQLPAQKWAGFRWPINFRGHGLQYADLTLSKADETIHRRRFFTRVKRPPRLLSVGGDHRWASVYASEAAEIREITPAEIETEVELRDFDAIVLSGVPGHAFKPRALNKIARAVQQDGLGLMLINGPHSNAGERDETVIMSYNETAIEPLLPLSSRPRPKEWEPPSRHVVLLIDTSGSMGGPRLIQARAIASHIVGNLLRTKDYLDLITFSAGAQHLMSATRMDAAGKDRALNLIAGLYAGGGTDPTNALELIGNRRMQQCGLIFISDGEFRNLTYRPDCRATVFAIGRTSVPQNSPLRRLADPFPVPDSFDPTSIKIPYFEPEQRLVFFERDSFEPLSLNAVLRRSQQLPIPELMLEGNAVAYATEQAVVNAVRPKLTDPVLAFAEAGQGQVGVFTSGIPRAWLNKKEGRDAVRAWIEHIVPLQERDRYDFRIGDRGDFLEMRVALVSEESLPPAVDQLKGRLRFEDGQVLDLPFRALSDIPGTFEARLLLERGEQARPAMLVLEEAGLDALPRPQRLPLLVPPATKLYRGGAREALTYGINTPLLRSVASAGGGNYDPEPGQVLFRNMEMGGRGRAWWPLLVILGVMCYLAAIALQRWDP